eukprot:5224757-Heterocapsa_arctica.AAC.1
MVAVASVVRGGFMDQAGFIHHAFLEYDWTALLRSFVLREVDEAGGTLLGGRLNGGTFILLQ